MPPFDDQFGVALKNEVPEAKLEVTRWPTAGKSLTELEQDAKSRIRSAAPDLVVIAAPALDKSGNLDAFIHDCAWLMNWSLNFGPGGWDCVVVHPSVLTPTPVGENDDLIRRLVHAQDLPIIDQRSPAMSAWRRNSSAIGSAAVPGGIEARFHQASPTAFFHGARS